MDQYGHLVPLLIRLPELGPDHPERRRLRDHLAMEFLPVVTHIAARYCGRGEPVDDLRQVGTIGLLGALDRYAPGPGVSDHVGAFLGYAVPTVTGEIRRHFRDRTWAMRVSRGVKDLLPRVREAADELTREHHRAPRPSEIAERLGVEVGEVVEALQANGAYRPGSIDVPYEDDGTTIGETLGDVDPALSTASYRDELRIALAELPARERHMLILRFFGDLTQTQIAERMGISQMHVSRLISQSLRTLRTRMGAR